MKKKLTRRPAELHVSLEHHTLFPTKDQVADALADVHDRLDRFMGKALRLQQRQEAFNRFTYLVMIALLLIAIGFVLGGWL